MRNHPGRAVAVLAVLLTALALAACNKSSNSDNKPAGHNLADVVFATHMIPHHQQGVDLALMVPGHSTNADLAKLASGIASTQQAEIKDLTGLVTQWSAQADSDTHGPTDTAMTGMVTQNAMTKLESLNGADFDKLWLQSMISHHQGAIDMAKTEISKGNNPEAIAMAKKMVSAQQGEIDQMTKMLGG